jgi:hypothetical protein
METVRDLPVIDFGSTFKTYVPAIFILAVAKRLIARDTPLPTESDQDAWLACKLLIDLVPKYCKRNKNCKPDRLFAEGWVSFECCLSTSLVTLFRIPPTLMFFINFAETQANCTNMYFVATDDFTLKVTGPFSAALQSLFELHYVFDLAYAKELQHFFTLLEHLAGQTLTPMHAALYDLYSDMKKQAGKFLAFL